MSLTEETEEQTIDRLLWELDIRLPPLELTDEDSLVPLLPSDAEIVQLSDEFSDWLPPPLSS